MTLWGRPELSQTTREGLSKGYNEKVYGEAILVNARSRPGTDLLSLASRGGHFVASAGGRLVAARVNAGSLKPGVLTLAASAKLAKGNERLEPRPDSLFEGYWDLVESNGLAIAEQAAPFRESPALPPSVEVRGPSSNLRIDAGAEVEGHVAFDARLGPIVVEKGATIESFSRVMGPCYIGAKTKVFSAQVGGGTSLFAGCKVGGQVENSILGPHSNKAHFGYVGDSYVGEWVNLGAGSTFSNLKNTYGNVRVEVQGKRVDTGKLKLGPVVGDMSKVSIGALVHAGKSVGTGSHVTGLASVNVPSFTYYDGGSGKMTELFVDSVVETQRRMMDRRGVVLTRGFEALIRRTFASTAGERRRAGVAKGKIA